MFASNPLERFISTVGRPEFRASALAVIRELNRFDNPEAINGIAPLALGDAVGIGLNHQRKFWHLATALLFIVLSVVGMMASASLPGPDGGGPSGMVFAIPIFGTLALPYALWYLKSPGPDVVVIANSTCLYVAMRSTFLGTPTEKLIEWSQDRLQLELRSVTNTGVTTYHLALWRHARNGRRKSKILQKPVDEQVFGYWQQFSSAIDAVAG
jgi:hypothetical protein